MIDAVVVWLVAAGVFVWILAAWKLVELVAGAFA